MIHKLTNTIRWIGLAGLFLVVTTSCERDVSDDAVLATFPNTAEVYTDNPVGLTDEFFISIDPLEGANPEAFNTDDSEAYLGSSSIRIDVPAPDNPNGNFVGGIFRDRGEGRDLTGYDALTFWAKGSVTGTISEVGFGNDFLGGKFSAVRPNIQLTTNWKKYVVPMPDPSKLEQEKGMFFFTAGGLDIIDNEPNGNEVGWTFWLDEIKFEKLGTIGQPNPLINNGEDLVLEGFNNLEEEVEGQAMTFNLGTGENVTVIPSIFYYEYESSNPGVAEVAIEEIEEEVFRVIVRLKQNGTSTITATLNDNDAEGSLEVISEGDFIFAPQPEEDESNVVSIFSDAYEDIPVSRYNSFFEPFQTTTGGVVNIGDQSIIEYLNLNFVGIVFNDVIFPSEAVSPVDATNLTHIHLDVNVQEPLQDNDRFLLELTNYGASETVGSYLISGDELTSGQWVGFDIPLSDFIGLVDRNRIGLLLFNSSNPQNVPTISNVLLDNIYFYTE